MTTEKRISITIDKKGRSKIEAHGFEDNTCLAATKSVEEALGIVQGQRDLKPEALKDPEVHETLKVGY